MKRLRFPLQRAMMQIAVMEQQVSPPSGGSKTPPGAGGDWAQRTCPAKWSSAASNVKKAKANRVSGKTHISASPDICHMASLRSPHISGLQEAFALGSVLLQLQRFSIERSG